MISPLLALLFATFLSHLSPSVEETKKLNISEEAESALQQCYCYLGSGGQCATFVSADGNYVLKLFKEKAFSPLKWTHSLPFLSERVKNKKAEKRQRMLSALTLAAEEFSDETGILFAHPFATQVLNKPVEIIDKEGQFLSLDIDAMTFILQRRVTLLAERIEERMGEGDVEGAREAIAKILELHYTLYSRGLRNRDPNLKTNYGFIGDRPVLIDVGRCMRTHGGKYYEKDLEKAAARLASWIESHYPGLL